MTPLRRIGPCLLALLLLLPASHRAEAEPAAFDHALAAEVFATALAFMSPRILDPEPVSQLTLWGLGGLPALDPTLGVAVRQQKLVLSQGNAVLASLTLPAEGDIDGWGRAAADLSLAAWNASSALRQGGGQALVTSFFDELFNHLDPYSRYVGPEAASGDEARRDGSAGIGVELGGRAGAVVIARVKADGPAAAAGIRAGDRIIAVDGQSTGGVDAATLESWLAGPEDSQVDITLRQGARLRQISLTRALVTPETVFPERIDHFLVLRVTGFSRDTDSRIEQELIDAVHPPQAARPGQKLDARGAGPHGPIVRAQDLRGIVLDLRGNRGGLLRQAALAADSVLAGGIIAITAGRDPEASMVWRASTDDVTDGLPIVVLVDGRTASAAEILAAALQDQGRAVVVGSATLGKGLVQTIAPLPDGGELFVTWSRVLTPSGYPLQGLGVLPQICTSLGQEQLARQMASLAEGRLAMRDAVLRHAAARAPVPPPQMIELRAPCPAAEGRDGDLRVAQALLDNPAAYNAALLLAPAQAH